MLSTSSPNQARHSAAILVGGAATRMNGAAKALLEVGGRSILEWLKETLAPRFEEILLVSKEAGPYEELCARQAPGAPPLRLALDALPGRSSLTGIHTALANARTEQVFLTACDTPFLRPQLLSALLAHLRPEDDVVLPLKPDGYFEPLCAFYSRRCLPHIEAQLARGDHKIIRFFDKVRVNPLPVEELLKADPGLLSFRNANTPDELRSLRDTAASVRRPTGGPVTQERISRDLALERIRHHIREYPPQVLDIPLMDSLGLVCAQDLFALRSTPAEPRSSVDGYALASQDVRQASEETPVALAVCGQIRPSTAAPAPLQPGQAAGILTGGPLPAGADCVVTSESVNVSGEVLRIVRPVAAQEHVRGAGSDLKAGTRIVRKGEDLTPAVLAALSVSGAMRAKAFLSPKVLVLALGNELEALDALPAPGHMPADNLLLAAGLMRNRSVPDVRAEVCPNDLGEIARRLGTEGCQCIVTTGGTGPGQRDFILRAAQEAGFTPLFTGLTLTPGKSMFAAVRGGTLLFALPGTPWAVFSLMHALVLPALCWLRGRTLPVPGPILARPQLMPLAAQLGWERLVPCTISPLGAELQAQPLLDRAREARLDMLQAQGLLIVSDKADTGELLPMIPIWENRRGHRLD